MHEISLLSSVTVQHSANPCKLTSISVCTDRLFKKYLCPEAIIEDISGAQNQQ